MKKPPGEVWITFYDEARNGFLRTSHLQEPTWANGEGVQVVRYVLAPAAKPKRKRSKKR